MAGPCEEYGFEEVGEGWHFLLKSLDIMMGFAVERAVQHATVVKEQYRDKECKADAKVIILQIKEKFGGLRVYWSSEGLGTRRESELIGATEITELMSLKTCETCGSTKEVESRARQNQRMGWIKTFCAECHSKNDEK